VSRRGDRGASGSFPDAVPIGLDDHRWWKPHPGRAARPDGGAIVRWPFWIAAGLGAVVGLGWLGLQVQPAPFPPYSAPNGQLERVPLREDLPAPVARYYRALFGGEGVPLVESAVLTGRGTLRFGPVALPARFRFTHAAGRAYRHYIEATWFGRPLLKVNEAYLDGHARMELPFGIVAEGPKTDSAANLGMWAEAMAFPSIYLTDPRVRWEPIDERTAGLVVPSPEGEDGFTVDFDPTTGLIRRMRTMRYRDEKDTARLPWSAEQLGGNRGAARWGDQGYAWLVFTTEEVVLNPDVSRYVRGRGV
jgi:hypothetical protein